MPKAKKQEEKMRQKAQQKLEAEQDQPQEQKPSGPKDWRGQPFNR